MGPYMVKTFFMPFMLILLFSMFSVHAVAMTNKERLLFITLETWDRNSNDDKKNIIELFRLYDIDSRFLTSGKPHDDFIKEEVLQLMRSYKRNYESSEKFKKNTSIKYQRLREYVNNESFYSKLMAFFYDVEKIFSENPTLSETGKHTKKMQQTIEAIKEKKEQEKLAQQKMEEELKKEAAKDAEERRKVYEEMNKKAIKMGFSGIYEGIYDTIVNISDGTISFESAKKYLIESDESDINRFRVQGLVGKYAIYVHESRGQQIALIKEHGMYYGNDALLQDGFFKIVGIQQFNTVLGATAELIILKRVDFKY